MLLATFICVATALPCLTIGHPQQSLEALGWQMNNVAAWDAVRGVSAQGRYP